MRERIEQLYRDRFAAYVGATAGILGDRELARDVVQDGFVRALTHQRRFHGGSLEAWVWRIILNRARDVRRQRTPMPLPAEPAGVASPSGGALAAAIAGLSERRRTVVLLRYVAGLPNTEIAAVLGLSPGTVAATLSAARAALSAALAEEELRR